MTLSRFNPFAPLLRSRRATRELRMTELRVREAELAREIPVAAIVKATRQSVLAELAATGAPAVT